MKRLFNVMLFGLHLPQRREGQHGDLKTEAAGALGLCQMPSAVFFLCVE